MYEKHIEAVLAAWNKGDLDGLDAFADTNCIRLGPATFNQDAHNLAELKQVITDTRTAYPDFRVTIDEVFFQGDRVIMRWTVEGTNTGPGNFPPTGKNVKILGCSFNRFRGGKLIEELVYYDELDMMTQLGLMELPAAQG